MNGQCQNGGCQRLATVLITIPMLGERHVCHICCEALQGLGFIKVRDPLAPKPAVTVVQFPGAA